VYNGNDALDYGMADNYDGIILDIMMPGRDGLSVLRELRANGVSTPVLMLTAKAEIDDRIIGLDAGADDYLTKPFAVGELLARLRAIVRRRGDVTTNDLTIGDLVLNNATYQLTCGNEGIRLSNKEYQMMEMLMRVPGKLISAESFMDHIWGYDTDAEINVVWVYISNLRKKLASLGSDCTIRATRGVGYSLEPPK